MKSSLLLALVSICAAQHARDRNDHHFNFLNDRNRGGGNVVNRGWNVDRRGGGNDHWGWNINNNDNQRRGWNEQHRNDHWNDQQRHRFHEENARRQRWFRQHEHDRDWHNMYSWTPQQRAEWRDEQSQWNQFDQSNPSWFQSDPSYNFWSSFSNNAGGLFGPDFVTQLQEFLGR